MKNEKPRIVFVCEHGAAKSIIAAAYFNRMADEAGLNQKAIARGTNPDSELSPKAVAGLMEDGLIPTESTPQKLSAEELATAQQVVTFCKLPESYRYKKAVEYWEAVPSVSGNYERARDAILAGLKRLMETD